MIEYKSVLNKLAAAVESNPKYKVEDEINKNLLAEDARKYDPGLLNLLQKDSDLKEHFFSATDAGLVFKKDVFLQFITNKEFLPDSYTRFANKIGLGYEDGSLLSGSKEIVLNWPYKDAILEGGQDKDEQKRNEVFFNEVLAPDQITRLLDSKVYTGWKRIDASSEHDLDELKEDDNLILKGNNLVVLHNLKKRFARQVKLIYIDPPYNTGGDSFGYNDRFNHSTWLTFMKNRLEIARDLLTDDGVIFVHCDNNEQAYLKVVMDEIFDKENFRETITVVNNPRGRDYGALANMHEFIHVYSKTAGYKTYKLVDDNKDFPYEDERGGFEIRELRNRNTAFNSENRRNLYYPFWLNPANKDKDGFYEIALEERDGWTRVEPAKSQGIQTVWRWGKEKSSQNLNINIVGKDNKNGGYQIVEKYRENTRLARSVWWDKEVNSERGSLHVKQLFDNKKVFAFPKPEELLSRILQIGTQPGDLVLDFHLGSGTTAAVAHKLGRRYIGIEQMGYIDNVTVERLKKVIAGEQGGISETIGWQGGGSFVYAHIMNNANKFRERIERAKDDKEYLALLEEATSSSFLSYRVDPTKLNEAEFKKLSAADKRRLLLELIDNNTLYVNYEDINEPVFKVSESDKKHNAELYK